MNGNSLAVRPVILGLVSLLGGWLLMLLMGVLHGSFIENVPAVGLWPCVAVWLLVTVLSNLVRASDK